MDDEQVMLHWAIREALRLYEQKENVVGAEQARALHWFTDFEEVLDDSDPPFYKWFKDGKLNASYNCLDRHVENGLGERVAFHWRGEEGEERDVTYEELLRDVKRFANALKDHGIEAGDIVGIYLPMIPEVVVAMLACARRRRASGSCRELSRFSGNGVRDRQVLRRRQLDVGGFTGHDFHAVAGPLRERRFIGRFDGGFARRKRNPQYLAPKGLRCLREKNCFALQRLDDEPLVGAAEA
jgi:hypothetical protein